MKIRFFDQLSKCHVALNFVLPVLLNCNLMSETGPPLEVMNPLSNRGFSVIRYTDPAFDGEVHKLLSPVALLKAKDFLPLSAVVVNNTGQYIWGFTLIYTYLDRIAPVGTPWRHVISPKSGVSEHSRMLGPGCAYLITPVSDFLASRDASGNKSLQPYLDEGLDRIIELFNKTSSQARLQLSVDSIIFDDGLLVGPDAGKQEERINQESQADKELLASIDGLTGDALRKELLAYSRLDMTNPDNRYRRTQAEFFLKILKVRGESGLQTAVQSRRMQQRFIGSDVVTREGEK